MIPDRFSVKAIIFPILGAILVCLSYLNWVNGMILAPSDKIRFWFPHFAGIWMAIRTYLRPAVGSIFAISVAYLLRPILYIVWLNTVSKKEQILHGVNWFGDLFGEAILHVSYAVGSASLLFVVLNLLSLLFLKDDSKLRKYSAELHNVMNPKAYQPSRSKINIGDSYMEENIMDNIRYTYLSNREFDYYPRLEEVHSSPYHSRHLNVINSSNDLPNRLTLPPACGSKKTIYCFGGSTTFGTLISDEHTYPSLLMRLYQDGGDSTTVKNYGVCGYNANQETAEFLELLRLGHRPSLAIFMDGVNVGPPYDGSEYTLDLAERFESNPNYSYAGFIYRLPLFRLVMPQKSAESSKSEPLRLILAFDSTYNHKYANKLIENAVLREMIGKLYNVKVISFLQPNVFYNYDVVQYQSELFQKNFKQNYFYNYHDIYDQVRKSGKLRDLSNLFPAYGQAAVVDILHYSPDFNRFLAEKISACFSLDSLPDFQFLGKEATGIPFNKKKQGN